MSEEWWSGDWQLFENLIDAYDGIMMCARQDFMLKQINVQCQIRANKTLRVDVMSRFRIHSIQYSLLNRSNLII